MVIASKMRQWWQQTKQITLSSRETIAIAWLATGCAFAGIGAVAMVMAMPLSGSMFGRIGTVKDAGGVIIGVLGGGVGVWMKRRLARKRSIVYYCLLCASVSAAGFLWADWLVRGASPDTLAPILPNALLDGSSAFNKHSAHGSDPDPTVARCFDAIQQAYSSDSVPDVMSAANSASSRWHPIATRVVGYLATAALMLGASREEDAIASSREAVSCAKWLGTKRFENSSRAVAAALLLRFARTRAELDAKASQVLAEEAKNQYMALLESADPSDAATYYVARINLAMALGLLGDADAQNETLAEVERSIRATLSSQTKLLNFRLAAVLTNRAFVLIRAKHADLALGLLQEAEKAGTLVDAATGKAREKMRQIEQVYAGELVCCLLLGGRELESRAARAKLQDEADAEKKRGSRWLRVVLGWAAPSKDLREASYCTALGYGHTPDGGFNDDDYKNLSKLLAKGCDGLELTVVQLRTGVER